MRNALIINRCIYFSTALSFNLGIIYNNLNKIHFPNKNI